MRRQLWWIGLVVLACSDPLGSSGLEFEAANGLPLPDTLTAIGDTVRLRPSLRGGSDSVHVTEITWTSSDSSVLLVSRFGLVTATGAGSATIHGALSDGRVGSVEFVVHQRAARVEITSGAPRLIEADSIQLEAVVLDANGFPVPSLTVRWTSTDTLRARVDERGMLTALRKGVVEVWVNSDGAIGRVRVSIDDGFLVSTSDGNFRNHCALSLEGFVHCFSVAQGLGVAYGPPRDQRVPLRTLSVGGTHLCGLGTDDRAYCWGHNGHGEIGIVASTTVVVADGIRLRQLSTGRDHNCGLGMDGALYCWGDNTGAQIAMDGPGYATRPEPVLVDSQFIAVAGSDAFTCAVSAGGRAWCWGIQRYGRLGRGDELQWVHRHRPGPTDGLERASVALGPYHACSIDRRGFVDCWGLNGVLQLGRGGREGDLTWAPAPVGGSSPRAQRLVPGRS